MAYNAICLQPSSPQQLPNGALEFDLVLSQPSAFRGTRQDKLIAHGNTLSAKSVQ